MIDVTRKDRTFLATTALNEFWDTSQSILFLGEWCKPYTKKSIWQNLDAALLTHSTLEVAQSYEAHVYTTQLYEALLPQIADWLNKVHSTKYALKYWQIVVGPFLLWYIQVVYSRYSYLKVAYSLYPELNTIGLAPTNYVTPINTQEFCLFAADSDAWNLQIFTQLLTKTFKTPISYQNFSWDVEIQQRKELFGKYTPFKKMTKLKIELVRFFARWKNSQVIGLCGCEHEFSKTNLYKLIFLSKFRVLPLIQMRKEEQAALQENAIDLSIRDELTKLSGVDDFSQIILDTLRINIPLNFIEYYHDEAEQSEKCFPYPARALMGGWMQNDRLKLWGAKKAEQGTKLINMQHGGGYGAWQYSSYEYLERKNSDMFITWGWQEKQNAIPAPSILVCERYSERKKKLKLSKEKHLILWAITEFDRYPAFIASNHLNIQQPYFDWQCRFANSLTSEISSQITMRLRPASKYYDYLKSRLPNLKIHVPDERADFFDQLCETRILISDNLNSTFHYGLAFNIPTILFWDKALWSIREEAKPYFKTLHDAGIYHDSPESAAAMLNKIAHDPDLWWNTKKIQLARNKFCQNYTKISPRWLNQWLDLLSNI